MTTSSTSHYTFGDSELAALRLRFLAEAYEPASRRFLSDCCMPPPPQGFERAIDLGCGPGYTTALVHELSGAGETIGIDSSSDHLARARLTAAPGVRFVLHDLCRRPFPVPPAALVFERFLLTHLPVPAAVLSGWADLVAPAGRLIVQETSRLETDDPVLGRYYELVGALQRHYGQSLYIGTQLAELARPGSLAVERFEEVLFPQPAALMARLHALNLKTWRLDAAAAGRFDKLELDELEASLVAIADGRRACAPVRAGMGLLVLRKAG